MLYNWNSTKLDILTSSSSNVTTPTLKTNEHLKKQTNTCFNLHFALSNFSHFNFNIKKKLINIWNLLTIYVLKIIFHMSMTVKKVDKKI